MQWPQSITIDGPAGAGKSTVGEQLALKLGYVYVDTGAFYRAVAWLVLHEGIDPRDVVAVTRLAQTAVITVCKPEMLDGRQYTVLVNDFDVTWEIRGTAVTKMVSSISSYPEVRACLRRQQRALGKSGHVVMVGRDIGTVVLPDADLKIYLTASVEKRAERRYAELLERLGVGNPALPPADEVLADIRARDENDRANMQAANDAITIDSDNLSIPEVVDTILEAVESQPHETRLKRTHP